MSIDAPLAPSRACEELLARLLRELEIEIEGAVRLRERLHALAEPSHREFETAETVAEALLASHVSRLDETGFLATVGPRVRPAIVVRAELDALPIREASGAAFASTADHMHACGHDVHMAALTALYRAASRLAPDLPAPLIALFQPSEEAYPSGAEAVAARFGELGPVDAIVAMHVHPDVRWGSIAAGDGAINGSSDNVSILVRGQPGHAAYPHQARDPVVALAQIISAVQQVTSRRIDPMHGAIVTISWLRAGSAENAIPDSAEARGTLRALDADDRERLRELVRDVVEHVAAACGCIGELTLTEGEPAVVNDPRLGRPVRSAIEQAGFQLAPVFRSCGSDDFGYYGAVSPSFLGFVGLAGAPGFTAVPLHHPSFLPPAQAVASVARAQAAAYAALATASGNGIV
jgi:amidohydrolase